MANLSNIFGPSRQQLPQGRPTGFESGQHASQFKRSMVMQEALERDLAPDDGADFYKFVGRRLFELGDTEGALAVSQQAQQILGGQAQAQAEAEQQAFENTLAARRDSRETAAAGVAKPPAIRKFKRGTTEVTEVQDPATGQWSELSTGRAFSPPNNININTGGGASELGEEVALIQQDVEKGILPPEVGAAVIESLKEKATQTEDQRDMQKLDSVQARKKDEVEQAAQRVATIARSLELGSITDTQARARFKAAQSRLATTIAKFRTPGTAEPNKDVIDEIKSTMPSSITAYLAAKQFGQDPIAAVVQETLIEIGAETPKDFSNFNPDTATEAELDAFLEATGG